MASIRSKAIRESARGEACIICGGNDAFAAHYNGNRQHSYGKGRGIKCNDLATAEFCYKCDQRFTEGSTDSIWKSKWERSEEFLHWIMMTNIRRMEQGDGDLYG